MAAHRNAASHQNSSRSLLPADDDQRIRSNTFHGSKSSSQTHHPRLASWISCSPRSRSGQLKIVVLLVMLLQLGLHILASNNSPCRAGRFMVARWRGQGSLATENSPETLDQFLLWARQQGLSLHPNASLTMIPLASSLHQSEPSSDSSSLCGGAISSSSTTTFPNESSSPTSQPSVSAAAKEGHASSAEGSVRGLLATGHLQRGDVLCKFPLSLALFDNSSRARKDETNEAKQEGKGKQRRDFGWDRLAVRILQERARGEASPWSAYIRSLPASVPLPLFLSYEAIQEIQWPHIIDVVRQMQDDISEAYSSLPSAQKFSFDDFRWAVSLVHSRAFTLPVREGGQFEPLVMMPFMDMINHHFLNQADWMARPIGNGELQILMKRGVASGQEVFTSFGPRSNYNLFVFYGFLLDCNPFDSLPLFGSFEVRRCEP